LYKLNENTPLTAQHVTSYIDNNISEQARLEKLYNYYKGKHDILQRTMIDTSKPNNKIVNPFCQYITDMITGYFIGVPVTYSADDEDFINTIKDIFNKNDEEAQNADLAKNASIFGRSYELIYLDSNANICFLPLDTQEIIPIYSDSLTNELLYIIRYYNSEDIVTGATTTKVEVYTKTEINYYDKSDNGLILTDSVAHAFGEVPVIVYLNNKEELGDFETVISLVDAYDLATSETANSLEYFADAYLALVGMGGTDGEDIAQMKENRVLLLDENGSAEWLIKDINDDYTEHYKERLDRDIHTFSKCPKMTDENFGTSSGIALRYKLLGLENLCSKKERNFKKGLQKRLKLICNILNIKGQNYDWRDITITFSRNIPTNISEIADTINKLAGTVSDETLLAQIPFVADVKAELQRKKDEVSTQPYSIQTQDTIFG
jgi:SPP1 family phage portal protein